MRSKSSGACSPTHFCLLCINLYCRSRFTVDFCAGRSLYGNTIYTDQNALYTSPAPSPGATEDPYPSEDSYPEHPPAATAEVPAAAEVPPATAAAAEIPGAAEKVSTAS